MSYEISLISCDISYQFTKYCLDAKKYGWGVTVTPYNSSLDWILIDHTDNDTYSTDDHTVIAYNSDCPSFDHW